MGGSIGFHPRTAEKPIGRGSALSRMPAHWLLARMGKRVLRPGGIELTRQMLEALAISSSDNVVEFAPGLGATARLTLQRDPRSYTAVERDEVAAGHVRSLLSGPQQQCVVGNAQTTGLPAQCASVAYGEAMLSMQPEAPKDHIVAEAARLLRPGGRYGIHELTLIPDDLADPLREEVSRAFGRTIHHLVEPLTVSGWRELLEQHGMEVQTTLTAPMHLLEPARLVRDEGLFGAARFVFNVARHREARTRVRELSRLFRNYRDHVSAVALVAVKRLEA